MKEQTIQGLRWGALAFLFAAALVPALLIGYVAVVGCNRLHSCSSARFNVAFCITYIDNGMAGDPQLRGRVKQGSGIRL